MSKLVLIILISLILGIVTTQTVYAQEFIRGNANNDKIVDISDAIFILEFLFRGGNAPLCQDAADVNDDGVIDISDAVRILLVLFNGQPMALPYPDFGQDPTSDDLTCESGICTDECSFASIRLCGVDWFQDCGYYDEDKCLDWQRCQPFISFPHILPLELEVFYDTPFPVGQIFRVNAYIDDNSFVGIKFVRAEIIVEGESVDTIDLSCEPTIRDGKYKCTRQWIAQNVKEGSQRYRFNFIMEDNLGQTASDFIEKDLTFLRPDTSLCKELIEGHNDLKANRVNLIFAGFGYQGHKESPGEILQIISKYLLDSEGEHFGLFSVEPFKSNRNKFNFWYVDSIGSLEGCNDWGCNNLMLAASCAFDNEYIIHVVDRSFKPIGRPIMQFSVELFQPTLYEFYCEGNDLRGARITCLNECNDGACMQGEYEVDRDAGTLRALFCKDNDITPEFPDGINPFVAGITEYDAERDSGISRADYCRPAVSILQSGLQIDANRDHFFVHEFGHLFIYLRDEYLHSNPSRDLLVTRANCYMPQQVPDPKEDCLANAPWKDLIGNGCGKDGIIDCRFGDPNYQFEIGCFQGCTSFRMFRPTENSIMKDPGVNPFSFGLWNEKLLKDELDKYPPFPDIESDLIAHYSFDNDNIKDSSGNGNDGFVSLGKGSFVDGREGNALSLDGIDDFAFIPPSTSLDGMEELTISAWVKFDDLSSRRQVILTKGLIDDYSYVLDIDNNLFNGKIGSEQGNVGAKYLLSEIGDGRFHHVALVYSGDALSLYVDGVRRDVVEHPLDGKIKATIFPLVFGARGQKGSQETFDHFMGIIDEVRIYNRVLNDREIKMLGSAA